MRIIIATGIFPPDIGGPATYCERLAKELSDRGIKTKVICYSDVKKYGNYDFPVVRISRRYPRILRHFLYLWNLLRLARGFDLIYAQNPVSAGFPAFLVSKILRKKMILKIVSDCAWEQYVTKVRDYDSPEEFQNKTYDLKTELLRKIQKWSAKGAFKIITPSFYVKNVISGWGTPLDKMEVIHNAYKPVILLNISKEEAKERIGTKGDIILSVGRLAPEKGFDTLIEAMPDLLRKNPNFKLLIVGEGEKRESLESELENLNLRDNVELTGRVSSQDIPFYFRAADIFVLDSQGEGLPHVILEAMQLGTPIIASRHGGNVELIEDNFNGLLIEYNDRDQLKKAILKLWQDKNLQNKFIQNSYKKIKNFNWEDLIEKTLNVLKTA